MAGSAAEAAHATQPCVFILTRGRGEQAVHSPLLCGAGQMIYVNHFFGQSYFRTQNYKTCSVELCGILLLENNLGNVLIYEQYLSVVNLYGSCTQSHL